MSQDYVGRLLIPVMPIEIHMRLAVAVGIEKAAIIQRLHLMTKQKEMAKQACGVGWYPADIDLWHEELPCFTEERLMELMIELNREGIILCRNDLNDDKEDLSQWISIDYEVLERVSS